MRNSLLIAAAIMSGTYATAQDSFLISEPNIATCQASLLDTGGESESPYGNNESFTTTICPDGGEAISLNWVVFDLSTDGPAPIDQMTIYDGDSVDPDRLIGTYTGSNSPGVTSASFDNPSGCITIVWTSNSTGTGNFAAFITCYEPCQPPLAEASILGAASLPLLACQNEPITFDASASTAAEGFNIVEYKWDFDDGVLDSLTGAVVTHSFPIAGEYVVQVYLTDDNECASTNLVDLQILVSTTPIFAGTAASDTVVCQGETVVLDATPVQAVTWSALPIVDFGDGIYLPDDQSEGFSSTLQFNGFAPGSTLTTVDDLVGICIDMEHSFMGDLVVSLTCPNGQTVIMHQQGGGGTYLGNALDGETDPPSPGECWNYCFTPNAPNSTWANCAQFGPTPNTMPASNGGNALIPGDYTSVQPLSQLVGCPLNGTWTINIADLWGADDGFLCAWTMEFAPELYPELTNFTPVLGTSALDSAQWTGANVVTDPNTPLIAVVNTPEPGTFSYVFSVTDNFGCTYDTTLAITVSPAPQGPILITGDEQICEDGVAYLSVPEGFDTYIWSPVNASSSNVNIEEAGDYTVTVAFGDCPYTTDPFTVSVVPNPEPVIVGPPVQCGDQLAVLSTQEPYVGYLWSNNTQGTTATVGEGQWFVIVTDANGCNGTSDPYVVTSAPNPTAAFSFDPLPPVPVETTVQFTDNSTVSGDVITDWEWDFGLELGTSDEQFPVFTYMGPGEFVVTLVVTTAQGCTDTTSALYVVYPPEILIPNVFTPNGDNLNDTFSIENLRYYGHELKIYSRWGTVVHESSDAAREWKASEQPDGTYYYVLTLQDGRELAGHITVLR